MHHLLNGQRFFVDRHGAGPPLLLLHGFTGSADEWAGLIPVLAPQRSLIAPDLIGHGRSAAPAHPERYRVERAVADMLALLDRLGLPQVELLGYSLGGRLALHLAAAAPARVRRLVLESASPGLADPAARAARIAADEALADRIEAEGMLWFVDHWAATPLFASQAALPPEVRAELRERRLRNSPRGLAGSLRGMGTGRQPPLWERLPALAVPTLLISGQLDIKFSQIGREMAALLPNARHIVVPAAGHTVHLERPQVFAEIVVRYLEENP